MYEMIASASMIDRARVAELDRRCEQHRVHLERLAEQRTTAAARTNAPTGLWMRMRGLVFHMRPQRVAGARLR